MSPRVFTSLAEIEQAQGEPLGTTDWTPVEQGTVDAFADLTGDHQWVHVDAERAAASPFGGTIAHGFMTLAMLPGFAGRLYRIDVGSGRLNYGVEKVRFPAPLPVGSRIRASPTFTAVEQLGSGTRITTSWTVEREGGDKPVCVARTLTLVLP
jgi:acyl dehydratase